MSEADQPDDADVDPTTPTAEGDTATTRESTSLTANRALEVSPFVLSKGKKDLKARRDRRVAIKKKAIFEITHDDEQRSRVPSEWPNNAWIYGRIKTADSSASPTPTGTKQEQQVQDRRNKVRTKCALLSIAGIARSITSTREQHLNALSVTLQYVKRTVARRNRALTKSRVSTSTFTATTPSCDARAPEGRRT